MNCCEDESVLFGFSYYSRKLKYDYVPQQWEKAISKNSGVVSSKILNAAAKVNEWWSSSIANGSNLCLMKLPAIDPGPGN